ncbi:zinc transporter [Croceibacterium sp. TMG7-5b_MA50]|uniref:ZIP family metal transporter n=1 Tax=Croceibacterium sp. TMG7-5b_MA50 TaxID=3121290 RepID=UPI003221C1FE
MMMTLIVVLVVSGALLAGAAWGLFGRLHERTEGFLVALAGGALLLSAVSELIVPSIERGSLWSATLGVAAGAIVFTLADYWIDVKWGRESGGGLLAAITLDGMPENLALGVALIGAGAPEVAALAGSILLSNLPEAAGSARQMADDGRSKGRVLALWGATAVLLSLCTIGGYTLLETAGEEVLATIRCFAAGAVIASLAVEVFPQAYREDRHWSGVATAIGVILALALDTMSNG